jgi:NADH-quinone oxidoreductase subunit G
VIQSAANVAKTLCDAGRPAALSLIAPECNSVGLALMEARPLSEACELAGSGQAKIDTLIVLENDLYRRMPAKQAAKLLESAEHLVVLDHLANQTTAKAELLLPAGTFAESDGTLVSSEGRAQRFFSVFAQEGDVRPSWRWLADPAWSTLDDALAAMAEALPQLAPAVAAAPSSKFRMAGAKIPRESHRYSGLTSIHANLSVVEPKPPDDPDSALAYSMEGSPNQPPGALQPFFWSPGWNSIQAVNKFQNEIGGPLRGGDPGVSLFEPKQGGTYLTEVPAPFARRKGEWLIVPLEHIFGSEELSLQAPGVASLAPDPYLAVNAADAASLQVGEPAGELEIELGEKKFRLPLKVLADLPAGIAGIPAGLTSADGAAFPAWSRILRVS